MSASSRIAIEARVASRSWLMTDERAADRAAHYRILVPERLRPVDRPVVVPREHGVPVSLALFRTEGEPRVEVEIIGLFLNREIAPADVLEVLLRDYEVIESRRVPSDGGDLLDALTRRALDAPYLSRWWTVKDGGAHGGRLYVLEGRAAEGAYPAVADELATMLASFQLLHPTPWDYFEQLKPLARKSPSDIILFYPESWQLEVVSEGESGPFVAHLWQVLSERPWGRITVVSASGLERPEAALESYGRSLNAEVRWEPMQPAAPFGGVERAWTVRGRASMRGAAVDLTVHLGAKGGRIVLLGLAGVPSRVDALAASSVRRALEIVQQTFRIA